MQMIFIFLHGSGFCAKIGIIFLTFKQKSGLTGHFHFMEFRPIKPEITFVYFNLYTIFPSQMV